jgi:two-component system NtrC family sensor kinase
MAIVSTIEEKCRHCYSCVRICPSKAIRKRKGCLEVIEERCILCGSCIKACPHGARVVEQRRDMVLDLLRNTKARTICCLDPAFPAVLTHGTPGQLVTALKLLGFTEVWEGAFGGELVTLSYRRLFEEQQMPTVITSNCAAIVYYVCRFMPSLVPYLAPIVSPMVAIGRAIKQQYDPDAVVVYVGPCIGRLGELDDPDVSGAIDQVLTFTELRDLLEEMDILREDQEETAFDGPHPYMARALPLSGGLLMNMGVREDLMRDDLIVTEGRVRSLRVLDELSKGHVHARWVEVQFCEGCIDGPAVDRHISVFGRNDRIVHYTQEVCKRWDREITERALDLYRSVDLHRDFTPHDVRLPIPSEEDIQAILQQINKAGPGNQLDCGACGYETCRDKAIAVHQGLAEIEMCLPHLLERSRKIYAELEKSHQELILSHRQLEQAQRQLIRTEKLASLGQLSAGVAHEINNPLGTITIYAHLMMRTLEEGDPQREDLAVIIKEASRAKEIVKGLLSFARETKFEPGPANLNQIVEEALSLVSKQALFRNIQIHRHLDLELPTVVVDAGQVKQVILNIVLNGAEAMREKGDLTLESRMSDNGEWIEILITDTGPGIPDEVIEKLFDPFFTTKEKGTGLGLAIAYGIVERHGGMIDIKTRRGEGTTFILRIPVTHEEVAFAGTERENHERAHKDFVRR